MEYIIVVFRSRESSINFSEILKNNGVVNNIVNTPKEVNVGCGLSVKTAVNNLGVTRRILYRNILPGFSGIFLVKKTGNVFRVKSI